MTNSVSGDMTEGNISKQIITFAAPIVLGNIFQQLYNTTDALIVGHMLGNNAFAAVSVANPIMSVVLFFLVGLCMGVSVLLAQYFGARKMDRFKIQLSTALISGVVFTISISAICFFLSKRMLIVSNTPSEILKDADAYLKIIFAGLIFSFLYNFYASALRAIGDSRTAFFYLVISSIINVFLDIVLIRFTPLGVSGAAIATVLSQAVSSLLCILYIYKKIDVLALKKSEFLFEKTILKATIAFSWAAALQQTFLYLGRLLIQGTVNAQGTDMITGYNAAIRLEAFFLAVTDGTAAALATFAGQNVGAGTTDRLRLGLRRTLQINLIISLVSAIFFFFFSKNLVSIYVSENNLAMLQIGSDYIKIMSFFYVVCAVIAAFQGFFRGIGKIKVTMFATFSQIIIRVALSILLVPMFGVVGVCTAVIVGWLVMFFYDMWQYRIFLKELKYS